MKHIQKSWNELKILRFWLWLYKRINARKYLEMNAHNTSGTTLSSFFLYTSSQSVRSAILTQPSMKPFVHQVTRWILIPQINCTSLEYICRSSDGPRKITENQVFGYLEIFFEQKFFHKEHILFFVWKKFISISLKTAFSDWSTRLCFNILNSYNH